MDIKLDILIKLKEYDTNDIINHKASVFVFTENEISMKSVSYTNSIKNDNQSKHDIAHYDDVDVMYIGDIINEALNELKTLPRRNHNVELNVFSYGGTNNPPPIKSTRVGNRSERVVAMLKWKELLGGYLFEGRKHKITTTYQHISYPTWKKIVDNLHENNNTLNHKKIFETYHKQEFEKMKTTHMSHTYRHLAKKYHKTTFDVVAFGKQCVFKLPTSKKLYQVELLKSISNVKEAIDVVRDYTSKSMITRDIQLKVVSTTDVNLDDANDELGKWFKDNFAPTYKHVGVINVYGKKKTDIVEDIVRSQFGSESSRPNSTKEINEAIKFLKGE